MSSLALQDSYQIREERQEYIPINYRSARMSVETANEIVGSDLIRNLPPHRLLAPLWSVSALDRRYKLIKPLLVRVYLEDGLFFAENETLLLFGNGITREEAIEDLSQHIVHFYHYYKNLDWSQLIGDARRLKMIYEDLLSEE